MELQNLIGYLVHRTDVKMTNYFTKQLKPYDITPEQWSIISVLNDQNGLTQKELAEAIDRDQTTVARMIHSMEKKEFVKKVFNDKDKRSHYIFLTEKGEHIKNKIIPVVNDAHHFVTTNLDEQELKQLKLILNKLYNTRY
ncbi:MarR family winged helix-turn-helix transcriptional regulator [Exiguobacterium sp. s166]|uniref:MarR family winged helix-turn-helix transcriptional regulator n=1 Tax=Exiguobacterium sp. s166 TaxID=2751204 RepID=UPI001BEB8F29|nr:MarR family transcriptional regulator [Exiguobacterium sp. s166]